PWCITRTITGFAITWSTSFGAGRMFSPCWPQRRSAPSLNIQTEEIFLMNRAEITELILQAKLQHKISWAALADVVGQSKEWTTAALLGQMTLTEKQAEAVGAALELPEEAVLGLQVVPYKGSLP